MAYLYLDYKKRSEQNPGMVVSTLLKQILCQYPIAPKAAQELFTKFKEKHGLSLPQLSEMRSILTKVCSDKANGNHYIILDALDEYSEDETRGKLLKLVSELGKANIHLFATSRPYPDDIMNAFAGSCMVEAGASNTDLLEYVLVRIRETTRLRPIMTKSLVNDITKTVLDKARGM